MTSAAYQRARKPRQAHPLSHHPPQTGPLRTEGGLTMPLPLDFLVAISPLVVLFVLWLLED
jgi:hypothetical protein